MKVIILKTTSSSTTTTRSALIYQKSSFKFVVGLCTYAAYDTHPQTAMHNIMVLSLKLTHPLFTPYIHYSPNTPHYMCRVPSNLTEEVLKIPTLINISGKIVVTKFSSNINSL